MVWTYSYVTNAPNGSEDPKTIDTLILNTRLMVQERMDVDHIFEIAANAVDAAATGKHKHVTLAKVYNATSPLVPATLADEGMLYVFDAGGTPKAELHWQDEDGNKKQITDKGILLITRTDLQRVPDGGGDAELYDDDTIECNTSAGLRLKAGGAATGIKKTHLATDANEFVDDETIEIDGTNGLQIKVPPTPSAGADAYPSSVGTGIISTGTYTGDDGSLTVDTGANIRFLLIKNTGSGVTAIKYVNGTTWKEESGTILTGWVTVVGTKFTVDAVVAGITGKERINKAGHIYTWYAIGDRP